MKKVAVILLIMMLLTSILFTNYAFATNSSGDGISEIKEGMKNVGSASNLTSTNTAKLLNTIIGILQVVGTGISLIVISLLGIKYLIASPSEKADVKKNIMPIIIGCILLFAAVNIVGTIEKFTNSTLPNGSSTNSST